MNLDQTFPTNIPCLGENVGHSGGRVLCRSPRCRRGFPHPDLRPVPRLAKAFSAAVMDLTTGFRGPLEMFSVVRLEACDTPQCQLFSSSWPFSGAAMPSAMSSTSRTAVSRLSARSAQKPITAGTTSPRVPGPAWKCVAGCRLAVAGSLRPLPVSTHTTVAHAWQAHHCVAAVLATRRPTGARRRCLFVAAASL